MRVGTTPAPATTTYTSLLYAAIGRDAEVEEITLRKLLRNRYDIVHVHWPEWCLYRRPFPRMLIRSALFVAAVAWARFRGAKLVWTAHNVVPHERIPERFGAWFFGVFTRLVDAVVSPSGSGLRALRERYPRLISTPASVVPIGHLRGRYPDHGSRRLARERLGIPIGCTVATFFGNVRPYKNVPLLIREFRSLSDPDTVLLVAGRPLDDDVRADVERAAGADPRVQLHLGYVDDDAVQEFMRAADIVVLPYAESSNSFVALLAFSFDRPILAPNIGGFPELAVAVGQSWVRLYEGPLSAERLRDALSWSARERRDGVSPDLDSFSWPTVAAATVAVYREVIGDEESGFVPAGFAP
jgi:glycosyltransferase involved in cell wall biosynthesis